eukprot:scaffold647_cov411-Prasinococcus_capsulatus_cf.AAC.5
MGGQERSVLDNRASRSLKQIVHGRSLYTRTSVAICTALAAIDGHDIAEHILPLKCPGSLPGPFYLNAILNFLVEVPALLLAIPMFDRLGRRFALGSGLVVGALCMVGMTVGDWRSIDGLLRTFAFLAKFALQVSFGTVLVYTVELFPTVLRSFGLGSCSFAATMGGVVAPVVLRGHELQGLISLTAVTLLAGVGVLTYSAPPSGGPASEDNPPTAPPPNDDDHDWADYGILSHKILGSYDPSHHDDDDDVDDHHRHHLDHHYNDRHGTA